MMFHFAIKNILFYKGRSVTTFILTFISTLFFILYVSIMDGSHKSMLENSLKIYTGAIEIYKKGYREDGGNHYLIQDVKKIKDKLKDIKGVEVFSSRYETFGLLSTKEISVASLISAIEPDNEKQISLIKQSLKEGSFLSSDSQNCLYMGVHLVKKLHLKIGDEVAFIGNASDNSFAADIFEVCGSFQTGYFEFDTTTAFVNKNYFDTLMFTQNKASYITLKLKNLDDVDEINTIINQSIDTTLQSLTWKTLMKTMVEAMEVDSIFGYISLALFFIVIFFVVMIYGFINVSTRINEFGVLRSIGFSKHNLFQLLFYEIFILSTFAVLLATPIASAICYYYSVNPVVIDGISQMYKDYGIVSDEVPFSFDTFTIFWNVMVIYSVNLLSILYPYFYIKSFKPIEAIKHV